MIAMGQDTDDLGSGIVDPAQRCDLRLDFRLELFGGTEVAAFEYCGLDLIWLEEAAHALGKFVRISVFLTDEEIHGYIFELGIDMKGQMAFIENNHEYIVIFIEFFSSQIYQLQLQIRQGILQCFFYKVDIGQFAVFAIEQVGSHKTG